MHNREKTVMGIEELIKARESPEPESFTVGFGKHRDALVSEVPKEYINWAREQVRRTEHIKPTDRQRVVRTVREVHKDQQTLDMTINKPTKDLTKKQKIESLKYAMLHDDETIKTCLIKIYNNQTSEEQSIEETTENNNIGFTGADAELLTSFAKQYLRSKYLSDRQMYFLRKKMPKYARQIIENR